MLVPLSWLKEYVEIDVDVKGLCEKLVGCGFEVEKIIDLSENIKNVVTAKIEKIEKHPDADRLKICQLNIGKSDLLQIVTAADNVHEGDIVPVALNGAKLPDGTVIKNGNLRGVKSYGMMCGGEELGLTDSDYPGAEYDGILQLDKHMPIGIDINTVLEKNDIVLDIGVTANRPECNSVYYIAMEVAAVLNKKIKPLNLNYSEIDSVNDINVKVLDSDLCPHYMAGKVIDVTIKESPKFIKNRLRAVGIRSINNIVDITNYVLYEVGQPMHAFDYDIISGKNIIVRRAVNKEKIVALDDKERELNGDNLLICDMEKPIAIAGIMGGKYSAISDKTDKIVFESAKFARDNIRHSSKELNLKSDSSSRYEKGVGEFLQEIALKRAFSLIEQTESGKICKGICNIGLNAAADKKINLKMQDINDILGVKIDFKEVCDILNKLNFEISGSENDFTVTVPIFREDVNNKNDIAEEVIRFYGYDKINSTLFERAKQTRGGVPKNFAIIGAIKSLLRDRGLSEIVTYSFTTQDYFTKLNLLDDEYCIKNIKLMNPLGEQLSVMRTTLVHSMLETVALNLSKGNKCGGLFEIAKVYLPKSLPLESLPLEEERISVALYGANEDFYTLKNIVEAILQKTYIAHEFVEGNLNYMHPYRCAEVKSDNISIGYLGEIHPDILKNYGIKTKIYIAELNMEYIKNNFKTYLPYKKLVKFPAAERDLAIIVDNELASGNIIKTIKKAGGKILEDVSVFDVYCGQQIDSGKKSIAFSLTFRASDRTLGESEINNAMNKIVKEVEKEFSAKLR